MRTSTRPRTRAPEERREELMNAARDLFLEQGVAPTTIERITTRAGVAKGTFYLYFSSKEDLLAALRECFAQDLLAGIEAAIAKVPHQAWNGKLATWAQACVTGYLDSVRMHDIVFCETHPPTRKGLVDNIVIDQLSGMLQAGVDAGAWAIDDSRLTAIFLFSGLHAIVDDAHTREKRLNRRCLTQRAERLCLRAVGLL